MLNYCLKVGAPYIPWFHFLIQNPSVAVSVSNIDLTERVCHLTNKIYWEILLTRDKWMTYITMGRFNHSRVSAFSHSAVQDCSFLGFACADLDIDHDGG